MACQDRPGPAGRPSLDLQEWFVRILNEELEKFNDFYVDKEEEFIIRLQELKERIERLKEKSSKSGVFTSESKFSEEIMDIRKDFVTIHGEMVLLKNYSSLNFAGLVKILKKYDKRTGGLLRLPFTQLVLGQPFFTIEPLTMLVRECEANLEVLFPLEAEVIESTSSTGYQSKSAPNNGANTPRSPGTLGEETLDIYRGTLAAMRAIRGLQKASSTCNPLSFSALFRSQDDDGNGAVTAENSPANSSAT
ncbi:SPX domain containing protein [Quillaja saponaria]|uniref:SPX domain containing protein n=1 Tax=Quillaja saponaria TaxID=32244 RepID=A0AAD7VCM4_QUISA|nr:SPX domain containing protein [Quillaja saponaria]KAJ7971006.1 SPX domain containing protein [Quillaja saponaria]